MNKLTIKTLVLIGIIACLAIYRIIPHPVNVAPVMAMSLFAGATFDRKWLAIFIPIISMFLSDLVLGLHGTMPFVYGAMIATVFIGFLLRKTDSPLKILLAGLSSSVLFFIVTNFGVWLVGDFYPKTLNGLSQCYLMALPFFQNSLLGDLFFLGVLFFSYKYFLEPRFNKAVSKAI